MVAKTNKKTTPIPPANPPQETATQTAMETSAAVARHHELRTIATELQRIALRLSELGCSEVSYGVQKSAMRLQRVKPGQGA